MNEEQINELKLNYKENIKEIINLINRGIITFEEAQAPRNFYFIRNILAGYFDIDKIKKPISYYVDLWERTDVNIYDFSAIFNLGNIELLEKVINSCLRYLKDDIINILSIRPVNYSLDDLATYIILQEKNDFDEQELYNFIKRLDLKSKDLFYNFIKIFKIYNIKWLNIQNIIEIFDKFGAYVLPFISKNLKKIKDKPNILQFIIDTLTPYSKNILPTLLENQSLIGLPENFIKEKIKEAHNNYNSDSYLNLVSIFGEKFDKFKSYFGSENFEYVKVKLSRQFDTSSYYSKQYYNFFNEYIPRFKKYSMSTDFILDLLEKAGPDILFETDIIREISNNGGHDQYNSLSLFNKYNDYENEEQLFNDVLDQLFFTKKLSFHNSPYINLNNFEYINKPYLIKYPCLALLPNEVLNQYKDFIFKEKDSDMRAWLVVIFHKNYPDIIKEEKISYIEVISREFLSSIILNINGLDDFLIKYHDYLRNNPNSNIYELLKNWPGLVDENLTKITNNREDAVILQELLKTKDLNQILSLYKNDLDLLPLLLERPWLVGMNASTIRKFDLVYEWKGEFFMYLLKDRFEELLEKISIENLALIEIFYPKNDKKSFIDKEISESFKDFILQNAEYLALPIMVKIIKSENRFQITEDQTPEEILLSQSNLPANIIKQYKKELWPSILSYPLLVGVNPQLIKEIFLEKYFKNFQNIGSNRLENYFYDLSKLLAVFGKSVNSFPIDIDNKIEVHQYSNKIPNFTTRNQYKYMGDFILKNNKFISNKEISKIIQNWDALPQEILATKNYDLIMNEFEKIRIERLKKYNPKDINFAKEAEDQGIDEYEYSKYEDIYLKSQNIPLPDWTNIGEIKLYDYVGHFVPRSDVRTMFIGSDEYLLCCQKIGGAAEKSAIHSQSSPFGALFLVENMKKGTIIALSWVWSNGNTVVFDNIETKVMKEGASANDKIAAIILQIYQEAAKRMKGIKFNDGGNVVEEVLVGSATYGIDQKYLKDLPDVKVDPEKIYPEDINYIYTDAKEERRKLANIYNRMIKLCNKVDIFASDISDKIENIMTKSAGYPQSLIKTYFTNLMSDVARFGKDKALSPFKRYVNQQIDPELFSMALSRARSGNEARDILRGFFSNVDELSDARVAQIWGDAVRQKTTKYLPNHNVPVMTGIGAGATPYLTTAPSTLSNTLMTGGAAAVIAPMLFKKPNQVIPNANQNNLSYLLANAKTKEDAKNILSQMYPNISDSAVYQIWGNAKQIT